MISRSKHEQIVLVRGLIVAVALSLVVVHGGPAVATESQSSPNSVPKTMDRDTEVDLALSACPASVARDAGVYVLGEHGYVKARDSKNGFTAIVTRLLPKAQGPQCRDAEGTRAILPRYLKIAEMQAEGRTADEIKRAVASAFASGTLRAPARPGVDYMLSSHNLVPNERGDVVPFPPHLMFYAPYLTNADLGLDGSLGPDGKPAGPVFVAGEGTPHALIIVPLGSHSGVAHAGAMNPGGP